VAQEPLVDYGAVTVESTPETTPPDVSPWLGYLAITTDGLAGGGAIVGSRIVSSSIIGSSILRGVA